MPLLQKNAVTGYRYSTIEDFKNIQPTWNGYNTSPDQVTNRLYASQYPTTAAINTGSVSDGTTQPVLARKYDAAAVYQYGITNSRPVSYADTVAKRVTVTAANDGVRFSGLTLDASDDFICFVARVNNPITLTFILRSSAGNHRTFAFSTSGFIADSNGYARFIVRNQTGTFTSVSVTDTGTPNMSSITEIDVIGSAASTIDWYDLQTGSNPEVFLGHQITEIFECLDEATWADTLETADRKCGLINVGKTGTSLTVDITLKVRTLSAKGQAAARGEVLKRKSVDVLMIQNAPQGGGGLTSLAISTGTLTITGLNESRIVSVSLPGGIVLDRVESLPLVTETTYHYNPTTGVFSFSTIYNGLVPTIVYAASQVATYFDRKNLKTGFVGVLQVERKSDTGKVTQWQFPQVELVNVESNQEDAEVSHTYTLNAHPFKEGNSYRYYRQIEL